MAENYEQPKYVHYNIFLKSDALPDMKIVNPIFSYLNTLHVFNWYTSQNEGSYDCLPVLLFTATQLVSLLTDWKVGLLEQIWMHSLMYSKIDLVNTQRKGDPFWFWWVSRVRATHAFVLRVYQW